MVPCITVGILTHSHILLQEGLSCTLLSHRGPDVHVKEVVSITEKVSRFKKNCTIQREKHPIYLLLFPEIVAGKGVNE